MCKELDHGPEKCPSLQRDEEFLEYAKDQGWRRCYKCRRVVEWAASCLHITYVYCRSTLALLFNVLMYNVLEAVVVPISASVVARRWTIVDVGIELVISGYGLIPLLRGCGDV